jgi:large subunit ribosomal protein L17
MNAKTSAGSENPNESAASGGAESPEEGAAAEAAAEDAVVDEDSQG